jgi:autotransporter-associated beta strand protein
MALDATWNVNSSGDWNDGTNWTTSPSFPDAIDDIARFLTAIMAPRNVSLGQDITIGTIFFDDNNNYTIRQAPMIGTETLTFDVSAGTAAINVSDANGAGSHEISAPMVLNDSLTVTHTSVANFELSGDISGAGGLVKAGAGAGFLLLSGTNSYGGTTSITAGSVRYDNDGCIPGASATSISGGASLTINDSITSGNALSLTANGTLNVNNNETVRLSSLSGSGTVNLSSGAGANNLFDIIGSTSTTYSGSIALGDANGNSNPAVGNRLTKSGTSTLTLTGASTYVSRTFIANGIINIQNSLALGAAGIGSATYVRSGGTLEMEGGITPAKTIFINGSGFSSGGAIHNVGGANTLTGPVTIGWSGGAEAAADATIQVDGGTGLTISSILMGANALTKTGSGTLNYTGGASNTHSGDTFVNEGTLNLDKTGAEAIVGDVFIEGGTLLLSQADQISDTSSVTLNSGTFDMDGNSDTIESFTFNAGTFTQSGATLTMASAATALTMRDTTITGDIAFSGGGDVVFDATNNGTATISGNVDLGGSIIDYVIADGTADPDMLVSGMITSGGITKSGPGTLELTGTNTLGLLSTVAGGTLRVNGSLGGAGDLVVNTDTTLTGNGPILKNIDVSGTLTPGGGVETMDVTGDVTQESGSTLAIELTPTANDLLDITGTYTILPGATINLDILPGNYAVPFEHVIVDTTGGVSGVFSSEITNFPLFEGSVTYTALQVLLQIVDVPVMELNFKGNAKKVAECIDSFDPPLGSDLSFVLNTFRHLPTISEIKQALLAMQPSAYSELAISREDTTLYTRNAVFSHMGKRLHTCCGCDCHCWNVWASGFSGANRQGNKREEPGYRTNTPGVYVGVDRLVCSNVLLGLAAGYTRTNFDWKRSLGRAKQKATYASLYGQWTSYNGFLEGVLTGAYVGYHQRRNIVFPGIDRTARSQHNSLEGSVHLRGGGYFNLGPFKFSPFATGDYLFVHEDRYREKGAGSLNLTIKKKNSNVLIGEAGVTFSTCFIRKTHEYTPFVQISGQYEKRYKGKTVKSDFNGCPLNVIGFYPSRGLLAYSAGVNYSSLCYDLGINFAYQEKRRHSYFDNAFFLEINKGF